MSEAVGPSATTKPPSDSGGKPGLRHVLEFEKPLAKIEEQIHLLQAQQDAKGVDYSKELRQLRTNYTSLLRKIYDHLSAWETVQVARHPQRPQFKDYVDMICRGHHKGKDTKEKMHCYWGHAHPEGYRKALRCMKLAEKFGLPVVTLIDTAGAYPGIGAEERGQAESIARNLMEMSRLRTPIVTVVTGEGGSGGALGIGVGDRIAMMEYGWYSVISPEGCSGILWKGSDNAADAAEALKLTSGQLKQLGVIDNIIAEPLGAAHRDPHSAAHSLEQFLAKTLRELKRIKLDTLLQRRYDKFRNMGVFLEQSMRQAGKAAG
jgi:acetyl-CoA carboxylase carboxyl transferase subunit alpha